MGMKDTLGDTYYRNAVPPPRTRTGDPATSRAAAASVAPGLTKIQNQVLEAFRRAPGGLCDYDLQDLFGNHGATYRTRRAELVEKGLLKNSGLTIGRKGRERIVWVIV